MMEQQQNSNQLGNGERERVGEGGGACIHACTLHGLDLEVAQSLHKPGQT